MTADDPKVTRTEDFIRRRYEQEYRRMTGEPVPIARIGRDDDLPCAECGKTTSIRSMPDEQLPGRRICTDCGHWMLWDMPSEAI